MVMRMRLIDATDLVRRVLEERDKIKTEVVERYSLGVPTPDRHGQAMRGGIRKALREIETSPTIDAVEVVRCKDCKRWGTGYGGETEHIKVCEFANYMVGENGYCVYGERKTDAEVECDA